jgi:FKBP-type peptidyl-prolyl cis-trans isomerase FkpA
MKKLLFILSICASTNLAFCQAGDYQKAADGLEYKIVRTGNNNLLQQGQYIELHFTNLRIRNGNDSVLNNTRISSGSQVMMFDSVSIPPAYLEIFKQMNEKDSLHSRTPADSVFKQSPSQMPSYFTSGDYLATNITIVNVYKTKAEADVVINKNKEKATALAAQKVKSQAIDDDLALSNYIINNNIKATKTPSGVYVTFTKEGIGPIITDKNIVKVMYKGKTLRGVIFDTNMDQSKGHEDPLTANLTNDRTLGGGVIKGMMEALYTMKKGTKGTMFIPSGLAYGPRGAGGEIGPDENLIFDVEVLSVQTIDQYKAEQTKDAAKASIEAGKEAVKSAIDNKKVPAKKTPVKTVKKVIKKK